MKLTRVGACGLATMWLLVFWPQLVDNLNAGDAPTAVDDRANTVQNVAVSIPVLTNDWNADGKPLAVLKVIPPAHGKVRIDSARVTLPAALAHLIQFAAVQVSNTVVEVGNTNAYPRVAGLNGGWSTRTAWNWVTGFFPGELWYLYELTGDPNYRDWATSWMAGLKPYAYLTNTCDVGFKINCSYGAGYRLTGNPEFREVVVQAGQSLSKRYSAAVKCIGDWDFPSPGIFEICTDYILNTELLYRAAELSGDRSFYTKAFNNAERSMWDLIRADGSSYQVADYNETTGTLVKQGTYAGYADESTWARGHAWATYGFTMAYRETRDARFLDTAERLADWYLANVPPDYVPYWDYNAPGIPNEPRDSSAASITLSALVDLSQLATNLQHSAKYWKAAHDVLQSLSSSNYLAEGTSSSGILLHGTGEPPTFTDLEVDVSLIYGDYYFIEALRRYANIYLQTSVTYIPEQDFVGTDSFTYQLCDSGGYCSTATVTVVVEPVVTNVLKAQIMLSPVSSLPTICFPTAQENSYCVEWRETLTTQSNWTVLATNIIGTGAIVSITDTNLVNQRFYRVRVVGQE